MRSRNSFPQDAPSGRSPPKRDSPQGSETPEMILAASNGDHDGDQALTSAQALARARREPLRVLGCSPRPPFPQRLTRRQEQQVQEKTLKLLQQQKERVGLGADDEILVRLGSPGAVIPEVTRELGAHLVVLGPHRPRALFDDLLGSTGDIVVRTTSVPCLIANRPLAVPPRRVLIPTDFSPLSLEAIQSTLTWLAPLAAEATIIEVLHVQALGSEGVRVRAVDLDSHWQKVMELVELPERVKLRPRLFSAPRVYDGVLRAAEQMEAELVVVGTHGHNFVGRLLVGSVTTACCRRLPYPLLLVPPSERLAGTLVK